MTSFLDALDSLSSPIEAAQGAVRDDNIAKLRPLLDSLKIGEESYTNASTKENLLHFAAHQSAASCTTLLVSPPYGWDPDRRNVVGRSAYNFAQDRGYLPLWFPLAMHTNTEYVTSDGEAPRTVSLFLIEPLVFYTTKVHAFDFNNMAGAAINAESGIGDQTRKLFAENCALFLELLWATPEVIAGPTDAVFPFVIPKEGDSEWHNPRCTDYPMCLLPRRNNFRKSMNIWLTHGLQPSCCDEEWPNTDSGTVESSATTPEASAPDNCWRPFPLMFWCRMMVRRCIVRRIQEESVGTSPAPADNVPKNYARRVASLPLPSCMRIFLGYRELWPCFPRHQVRRLHKYRLTNAVTQLGRVQFRDWDLF